MIGLIAGFLMPWATRKFGLAAEKRAKQFSWLILIAVILVVLVAAGLIGRSCYYDYKVEKTAEILSDLKKTEERIETTAAAEQVTGDRKEVEAKAKEEKAAAREKAAKEIALEPDVTYDAAIQSMCDSLSDAERQGEKLCAK